MQLPPQGGISSLQTEAPVTMPSTRIRKYFQDLLRNQSIFLTIMWDDSSFLELNIFYYSLHGLVVEATVDLPLERGLIWTLS